MFGFPHADDERASHHAKSSHRSDKTYLARARSDAISNSLYRGKVREQKEIREKCNAQDAEQSTICSN